MTETPAANICRNCGLEHVDDRCPRCKRPLIVDYDYLESIEDLAKQVIAPALDAESFEVYLDDDSKTDLQVAITELARRIRHWHYEGDGCLEQPDE